MSSPFAQKKPLPSLVPETRQKVNIVVVGHVDHGKSTLVGRILADTHSLPDGKIEQIKSLCERSSKPFEYAFLIDALKNEREQGITIDAARVFFRTEGRDYILIDAPGHIEFLKNMVTGASRAEAALLVIDAHEGAQENSRRHGYLLSMLGIRQVAVLINKMDLIHYSKPAFEKVVKEYKAFLKEIGLEPAHFIPVSGIQGDNLVSRSKQTPWYAGLTVMDALDSFHAVESAVDQPLRFLVQDVYKFTRLGDERRVIAGRVASGTLSVGDPITFYPSGKSARVKSIEEFNTPAQTRVECGRSTGITLDEQIYITRGELGCLGNAVRPEVSTRLRVKLFWLGSEPLRQKRDYWLKIGTGKSLVKLEEVVTILDASNLETKQRDRVQRHEVADCILLTKRGIAFDIADVIAETGRFVLIDNYRICGGGIIQEALDDKQASVREKVFYRNAKWERSNISVEQRAERLGQMPSLLLITGKAGSGRKSLAKALENRLFSEGRCVYFLGIGNFLHGVDAEHVKNGDPDHTGQMRRLAEVANILMDAGLIVIVTARELSYHDLDTVRAVVHSDPVNVVWLGDEVSTDVSVDLHLPSSFELDQGIEEVKGLLYESGVIFRPKW